MKTRNLIQTSLSIFRITGALVALLPLFGQAATFMPGNLVVSRIGDGSTTLSSAAFAMSLVEYNTAGTASGNVISIPVAASANQGGLTDSGSATSNGHLFRSPDGKYLTLAGYDAPVGTVSVTGTSSTANNRNVARIGSAGTVLVAARLTDAFNANNFRSVVTDSGNTYYLGGASNVRYADSSVSTATTSTAITSSGSTRGLILAVDANGNRFLVESLQTSISYFTGLPTSTATPTSLGITLTDCNAFLLLDRSPSVGAIGLGGLDTLYVADGSSTGSSGTAVLRKYEWSGSAWVAMGTATLSTSGSKLFGLTAKVNGNDGVDLYATTQIASGNSIVTITDSSNGNAFGGTLSGTLTVIATAAANTAFRGIAFAPVSYTVTYDGNGNTGGSAPSDNNAYAAGATVTVLGNTGGLTKTGYNFAGWNTTADGTGTTYSPGATFAINANTTLYALWISSTTYTVTYDGNGNTGGTAPTDANNYSPGATVTVLGNTGNLTKAGFAFAGWNTAANGSGSGYSPGNTFTINANTTLYAQDTANPDISVSTNTIAFGPVAVNGTSSEQSYSVSGGNLTADITLNAPSGFVISTTSGSGFGSSLTLTQSGGTVSATTIYVKFSPTAQQSYSGNIAHTSTGAVEVDVAVTGLGANPPSVSTQPATAITAAGATLNGTVTAANNAPITGRGFYYKTTPGVTTTDTQVSEGGTTQAPYSKGVTGLSPDQIYYYRSYAANSIGTTLDSSDVSFYTLANTPTAPTVGNPTQTSLDVAIGATDGNPAPTTYAVKETGTAKFVQADGTLGASAVFQTATAWGTTTVTGLSFGHQYTFQVQARNGASVNSSFGPSASASTLSAPLTPGNLVVYRVGSGTGSAVNTGNPVFLDEFTTAGVLVQSIPMPTTANGIQKPLIASGTATSEGLLNRSLDGRYLILTGYGTTTGGSSLAGTSSTNVPRVIGRVDTQGNIDTSTALTDWGNAQNPRSAISTDGTDFWGASANGVNYTTLGSTNSTALTNQNTRNISIVDGQLYISTSSSGKYVSTLGSGLPTAAGQPVTGIPGSLGTSPSGTSPYGFAFVNLTGGEGADTLYVADDGASTGIQKYSLVSGAWVLNGTITAASVRGITASVSGTSVTIYATTGGSGASGGGSVYTVTDTAGYNATPSSSSVTTMATASANTAFRGIAFAPKASQTISPIAANVSKTYGDPAYSAATTASSGLAISYASDNISVATVDRSGSVTIVGAGTAHITASQPGNDFYQAATPVQQTLTVDPAILTYIADPVSKVYGASNPAFTGTVTGFVGSDNQGNATTGTLSFDSVATELSGVGSYGIDGSGLSAANYVLVQALGNATALTVTARAVSLSGAKLYDGVASINAANLAVSNKVNADDVTVASGTATLSSANGGLHAISSLGNLALGGSAAPNYTLTGATGSARINPAPGAYAIVARTNKPITFAAANLVNVASDAGVTLSVSATAASSAQGGTAVLDSGIITYTPAADYSGPDSFTYTLSDDVGGSSIGTVQATVTETNAPSQITSLVVDSGTGSATLTASGAANVAYDIQSATDIEGAWTTMATVTASGSGQINYIDNSGTHSKRFYRLQEH
jgi:hypothetical protein